MAQVANKWDHCDCDWIGTGECEKACEGCEQGCRLYRDEVIHWRSKHWHLLCAFRKAAGELESQKT